MKELRITYVLVGFLFLVVTMNQLLYAQQLIENKESLTIGLLVDDGNELEARFAAGLAVEKINTAGGINGIPLKLIIRSAEGSWGSGSSKVVDLVFKEKVNCILGSIDGRNSHLAEQVIAKTQVLYLSAWASDPTLSKAYVPWYFSIVPTDDQQAILLLNEIYSKGKINKILVLHDRTYDAEQALKSLLYSSKEMKDLGITPLGLSSSGSASDDFRSGIENSKAEAIILLGRKLPLSDILVQFGALAKDIPIYTNLSAQASEEIITNQAGNNKIPLNMITPKQRPGREPDTFKKAFYKKYNRMPGPIAAYAYDGIMIMAEALRQSEHIDDKLLEALSQINYQGLTGHIQFDSLGRLKSTSQLLIIKE